MIDYHAVDRFGVPEKVFGAHEDDFYGAIGRIALLASLLEQRVRLIAGKLVAPDTEGRPNVNIDDVIKATRQHLARIEQDDQREALKGFLCEAKRLFKRRNIYLHSVWPAQADGTLFGHKAEPWESSERISKERLRRDLEAFVELNNTWRQAWAVVSWRQPPATEAGS